MTALHVLDIAALRAPFLAQPVMAGNERYIQEEIQRMEARSAKALKEATQQLASLKLKGTARKEQGAVAPTILKRAPKRDGLLVVGSQGLDALDRFMLGSVSTNLIHHATCPVLVVKGEASPLRRITLATDGSDASAKALKFVLTKFQPDRFDRQGRARADSRERAPCDAVGHVPGVEGGRQEITRTERAEADQGGIYGRACCAALGILLKRS